MRLQTSLLASLAALLLSCSAAFALNDISYVSNTGLDANDCTRPAPCRELTAALAKTRSGGEIVVLDHANFQAITINKSMTIRASGRDAEISTCTGTSASIVVQLGTADRVMLQGFHLNGLGAVCKAGILMSASGALQVFDSDIENYTDVASQGAGIAMRNATGAAGVTSRVYAEKVRAVNNAYGYLVQSSLVGSVDVLFLTNSLSDRSSANGLSVAAGQMAVIQGSQFSGSVSSDVGGAGSIISYGNNVVRSGAPTSTLPLK